jgi:hypothetical protein
VTAQSVLGLLGLLGRLLCWLRGRPVPGGLGLASLGGGLAADGEELHLRFVEDRLTLRENLGADTGELLLEVLDLLLVLRVDLVNLPYPP